MGKTIDISGNRYGRWLVLKRAAKVKGDYKWTCICDCGTIRDVRKRSLNDGVSKSCGCLNREISKAMSGPKSPHWKGGKITKRCLICDGVFQTKRGERLEAKYCSDECRWTARSLVRGVRHPRWRGGPLIVKCEYCGGDVSRSSSEVKKNKMSFCSQVCQGKWKSENQRQENHYNWNPKLDREGRKALRKCEDADNWRVGVFDNDLYECQACSYMGNGLNAHHIVNFESLYASDRKDLIFDVDNGITLCSKCHKEYHRKYGVKNNNEDQLWEFIANHEISIT